MLRTTAILFALAAAQAFAANWDGATLVIGNAHVERQWQAQGGRLFATSFDGRSQRPAPYPKFPAAEVQRKLTFTARTGATGPVDTASLTVDLHSDTALNLTDRFQIFPETRGVTVDISPPASPIRPPSYEYK
jgi:hypothetical protein